MLPDDTRRAVVTEDLADPMHRSTDDPRHPDARESDQADDTRQWAADEHRTDEPMHADPRVDGDHDSTGDDSVRDDLDRDAADRDAADRDGVGQDGSAGDGVHDDLGRDDLGADDATRDDGTALDRDDLSPGDESAGGGLTSSDAGMRDDALGDDLTQHDPSGDAGPRDGTMDDDLAGDAATAGGGTAAVAAATPGTTDDTDSGSLFGADEAERFKDRWRELQIAFVDEPRSAVQNADELVAEVMQTLAGMFAANKQELEGQWRRDGEVETEDLRLALQKYRSFFDQLLRA